MTELGTPRAMMVGSKEIARVWVAEGGALYSTVSLVFAEPGTWGFVFWDLATDVAKAYAELHGLDAAECLQRMRTTFLMASEEPKPSEESKPPAIGDAE